MKSDATLIRSVLAGDEKAFGSLVRRYQRSVYALVWSIVRDSASAEDVAQEAFMRAFSQLSKLRDPDAFAGWLRRIAANSARMWLRERSKREIASDMDRFVASEPSQEETLRLEIAEALASLSEKKREVAVLCYMDGFSRKDAARFLGLNEATLRKRLHDAKRLLQKEIVQAAERSMKEHLLPKGFEKRCICACERAIDAAIDAKRREVLSMNVKKKDCLCGCLPHAGKEKGKKKDAGGSKSARKKPGKNGR